MQATDEQIEIVSAFQSGEDAVIEALAGAGKTSTLRMLGELEPAKRGVYLAFNRAIKDDAKASFSRSVYCTTVHGLAFREVGVSYQHRLEGPRMTSKDAAELLGMDKWMRLDTTSLSPAKLARVALDTVTRFCHSGDVEVSRKHVPWPPGTEEHRDELVEYVLPYAVRAWEDISADEGRLKGSHDAYLKNFSLSDPILNYDYVLFDEAQDSSPVITHIVDIQDHAQKIICGDRFQQIYEWRGAINSMDEFGIELHLPLSQSFRFGEAIADEANEWLTKLDAVVPIRGSGWIDSRVGQVEKPVAVLCRTNATVVAEVMEAQKRGRQPALVGGGADIQRFAEAAISLKAGKGTGHSDLFCFKDWSQVQNYVESDGGGHDLRTFVRLIDEYGPQTVINVVQNCLPESVADVVVSTAHKAKGREWLSVKIADDFRVHERKDKDGEQQEPAKAELRLAYVACTRAREVLDPSALKEKVRV